MRILVTGAGGLVGGALWRHLERDHEVIALKHGDLDITDRAQVSRIFRSRQPELVINCAVIPVDACELDPGAARHINVDGPANLAELARETGAEFMHFSTNYVFDGRTIGRAPYTYEDETQPINVYGRTKLDGEHAVREAMPRSFIVRTAWVYGAGKASFLASVPRRLRQGESVEAITDAFSTTTYVADLAQRVRDIFERGKYGIYHVVNDGTCSYYEFACETARLIGLSPEEAERLIVQVSEKDLERPAPRPPWTPMVCNLSDELGLPPLRNWREALRAYVAGPGSAEPQLGVSSLGRAEL
jgi:dTDP-4-dehydrorhamnose reductase